jgi:subtilase family serine protease
MKSSIKFTVVATAVLLFVFATTALAQKHSGVTVTPAGIKSVPGAVYIPESSVARAGDAGVRMHTNFAIFLPGGAKPDEAPPYLGYGYETPASLACVYQLVTVTPGCNPNTVTTNPTGGSNAIAITDAYDDPWAAPDLAYFSAQFGIPFSPAQFQVVYANGVEPTEDPTGNWEFEEALDVEWAHAMAPNATIYLVEAASSSNSDLLQAVVVAGNLVQCGQVNCPSGGTGKGEITMSWGGDEFNGETAYDAYFTTPGVVYFAAVGDTPGVTYPCVSPNVVCGGGTATARNPSTGNFMYEIAWSNGGGGVSQYEPRPSYQATIANLGATTFRGVPDVSFNSSDTTAMWVWDSEPFQIYGASYGGWYVGYGTSFSDVAWAGIVNAAGSFALSSVNELTTLYSDRFNPSDIRDITSAYGFCGPYSGWTPLTGWDYCTGIGTPLGYGGK